MAGLPDLMTVEEAARVIRVGRTKAYAMAREWRATGGKSGLPVIDFGHALRVPLCQLETIVGGPLSARDSAAADAVEPAPATTDADVDDSLSAEQVSRPWDESDGSGARAASPDAVSAPSRMSRRTPRRRSRTPDQPTLPFAD